MAETPQDAPAAPFSIDELQAHVARELHDLVAHPLVELVLDLRRLRTEVGKETTTGGELARLEESARQVLRRTREMLIDLRGQQELRLDFADALRKEIATSTLTSRDGRRPILEVSSRWPSRINGWAAFNLLRIVQEAVANATRHAYAERIDIFLDTTDDGEAVVVVLDDGIGIRGAAVDFGMIGMSERALILGGSLTTESRATGGTRVEVRVPLERIG